MPRKQKTTYNVMRMFRDGEPSRIVASGLTKAEAQRWCKDPETSSQTCTSEHGKALTAQFGPWFDGWGEER